MLSPLGWKEATVQSEIDFPIPDWVFETLQKRQFVVKKYMPSGSVGAEIGVFRGVFSQYILEIAQPSKLFMVDGWEMLFGETFGWGKDYTCNGTLPTLVAKQEAIDRTAEFAERREIITSLSLDFFNSTELHFDWIYLDATHTYEAVFSELVAIHKNGLLYPNGHIIGDDFTADLSKEEYGICSAVNQFCRDYGYEVIHASEFSMQWVIRRPQAV